MKRLLVFFTYLCCFCLRFFLVMLMVPLVFVFSLLSEHDKIQLPPMPRDITLRFV
ncbi:MAG: hypothetical protein V4725_14225 [Bacteroidota bacterium]|nr:hypothetical protein [Ferruginibacter sp.]